MMPPQTNSLQETVNKTAQNLPDLSLQKGRRRSKNDNEGRTFKCEQCERTYLSYPALYTHKKTKHTPVQQNSAPSRGRGRPKKTGNKATQQDPISRLFFNTEGKQGGPTAVTYGFEEAFNMFSKQESMKYKEYQSHPLYIELYKLHKINANNLNYSVEHPHVKEIGGPPAGFEPVLINQPQKENMAIPEVIALPNPIVAEPVDQEKDLNEENKGNVETTTKGTEEKKCDEIFAEYLNYVAKRVNKKAYKEFIYFILLYRECFSANGSKFTQAKSPSPDTINETKPDSETDFCLVANAKFAPDMSNEFLLKYLECKKPNFGILNVTATTMNFCHWLFMKKYTYTRLEKIKEN
jgi:hypothetical protein